MLTPAQARGVGRRARRELTTPQRRKASRRIVTRILSMASFRHATTLAAFIATDEEPTLRSLLLAAAADGKTVLLPVIVAPGVLRLRRWRPGVRMRRNRFGIPEPVSPTRFATMPNWRRRTLLCAPLTACDAQFNRVGMGGGYYDRLFAATSHLVCVRRVGVAFDCQRVESIAAERWDAPLDALVTERNVLASGHRQRARQAAEKP